MDTNIKEKRAKCSKGTRKYKPLGDGCYTDEQIESHKKTKTRKHKEDKPAKKKKTPIVEEKTPIVEEKTPIVEEKTPIVEEKTPIDEEKTPIDEEKTPIDEEKTVAKESIIEDTDSAEADVVEDLDDDYEDLSLKEKEKKEYYDNLKNPKSKTDFLHPSLGNPFFSKQVSLRKEFENLKYDGEIKDVKQISDIICANPDFELLPHQFFVKGFMSNQTPYKSILLYHGLGSGKTCSAIGITEEMRNYTKQTGIQSRIFIVASPNVQDNFRHQLFDENKLIETNGIWSLNTCVGTKILNEINPTNSPMLKEKIISQANTIINRYYKFMGYLQFANYIEYKITLTLSANAHLAEQELVQKFFNNGLIVIDEVHNCTKESKTLSKQLKKLAKYADNLRFILLSATPMYNSPREIIWITNLMNLNDRRTTIKYGDVFNEDGNIIEPKKKDEDKGINILRRKLNGYISYVRGENPYTFPFRVYPPSSPTEPFITLDTHEQIDVPLKGKLYLKEIGEIQKKVYNLVIEKSLNKGDGLFFTGDADSPNFENMERLGYTKLQAPLQSLIIAFPHKNFDNIISSDDRQYTALYGQKGLENNMSFEYKDIKQSETTKITIKCNYKYKPGVPRIFSETELPKYSTKISTVCDCIRESANKMVEIDGIQTPIHGGIIIVYTQYIYGGIVPIALALEEMGFLRYGQNQSLFQPGFIKNRIDANTMKLKEKVPFDEFKQAKYMIISGDKYFSQDNAEDIKVATSKTNKYGEDVRVILISRAASEGLDFKFVRQVHVLEPWYNMNRIEQIIGRGVRNRSHCGLVFEERNVEIYLHATTDGEQETADLYVYRYAETKAQKIGKVTRLLKTVSVDCVLNHSQTNFTDKQMEAVAQNGVVMIVPSTNYELVSYKLGDKPYSEVCDYMKKCEYKCYPEDADKKYTDKTYDEMYDKEQIGMNSTLVIEKIKSIFKKENAYHIETIQEMEMFKNTSKEELYYALTLLIDGPEVILDKYGRQGRLINRERYYIFQPQEITSPNISLYESTIPVKTMNHHVEYKIETNDENIKTPKLGLVNEVDVAQDSENEQYTTLLAKIKDNIHVATREPPNKLIKKSDFYNWYYHLNSIECKPELENFKHFLKEHNIKKSDSDEKIKTILSYDEYAEYEVLKDKSICNTDYFQPVMLRLQILIGRNVAEYVLEHILDTLPHKERLVLAKKIIAIEPQDDLEKDIKKYFKFLLLNNKKTLVLANKDENIYYNTENWTELTTGEKNRLDAEMTKKMDVLSYSTVIGFIGNSKDEMVFKRKDLREIRNNKGAYLQGDSNKVSVIDKVNEILKIADSEFSFHDENHREPSRNTDGISKIAFAGIFEILVRKYNREKVNGKTWFLRPEQAIFNKIDKIKNI